LRRLFPPRRFRFRAVISWRFDSRDLTRFRVFALRRFDSRRLSWLWLDRLARLILRLDARLRRFRRGVGRYLTGGRLHANGRFYGAGFGKLRAAAVKRFACRRGIISLDRKPPTVDPHLLKAGV
jgi:hypothetical protein